MWNEILQFALIGFIAQLIDGAVGMAYKVTVTSLLLATGAPPVVASGSVHVAGTVTTAVSGLSHWHVGNVDSRLLSRIVIPGVIGGLGGALLLSSFDQDAVRPWISMYLLAIGIWIVWKAVRGVARRREMPRGLAPVAFLGGLLDAIGGGGWGPILTSTLAGRGVLARQAVGTTNMAEFFVSLAISFALSFAVGISLWPAITGLIIGGTIAAPLAALMAKRLPERSLLLIIGLVVSGLSLLTLVGAFAPNV